LYAEFEPCSCWTQSDPFQPRRSANFDFFLISSATRLVYPLFPLLIVCFALYILILPFLEIRHSAVYRELGTESTSKGPNPLLSTPRLSCLEGPVVFFFFFVFVFCGPSGNQDPAPVFSRGNSVQPFSSKTFPPSDSHSAPPTDSSRE